MTKTSKLCKIEHFLWTQQKDKPMLQHKCLHGSICAAVFVSFSVRTDVGMTAYSDIHIEKKNSFTVRKISQAIPILSTVNVKQG